MTRILDETANFRGKLSDALRCPDFAAWGTCAGLILMSDSLLQSAANQVTPV